MRLFLLPFLIGFCAQAPHAWSQTRVLKCTAADGSVSYLDARTCPEKAAGEEQQIRDHHVTLTADEINRANGVDHSLKPLTREQIAERKEMLKRLYGGVMPGEAGPRPPRQTASLPQNQTSYRCSVAGGVWYRHSPCPPVIGQVAERVPDGMGGSRLFVRDGAPVKQEVITRSAACRAIRSRASRPGRQLDEVPDPYDKLKGKDLC